jgi:hypothetical protein
LYGVLLCLTIANLGWYLGEGLHRRTDMVTADPYYYLRFARNLADGKFHIDGVVSELTRQYAEAPPPGKAANGPIWNSSIKSDGRMVYTIAMGYPLWLSLMLKLGGMGLCTISNYLLWAVVFTLVFFFVREALGRTFPAAVAGACAAMMLPVLDYRTFAQMTYLWREPLFFTCLLTALFGYARFMRTHKIRPLLFMAFALGYACSIKEANALHLPVFGLALILTPDFRKQHMIRRILLMGVVFLIGASPILIQNYLASGNPLRSLQTIRAVTAHAEQAGHGLHYSHMPATFKGYMDLYVWQGAFAVWWLLVVLAGVVVMWRRPAGRILAAMTVLHVSLYLMWGNPDFRHMYFLVVPCAVFSAAAVVWFFQRVSQVRGLQRFAAPLLLVIPIYMAATHPPKWPYQYKYEDRLTSADAIRFSAFLAEHVQQPALLISHRFVRDIIGTYTDIEVVRLTELDSLFEGFGKQVELARVIDDTQAKGVHWYYLDNRDLDPKSKHRRNLLNRDLRKLEWRHALKAVAETPASDYNLATMAQEDALRLFEVQPWPQVDQVSLTVPDAGAAFLYVDTKAAYTNVALRVDGVPFAEGILEQTRYVPVHELLPGSMVTLRNTRSGALPPMDEVNLRWIGWDEKIRIRFGEDTNPSDLFHWQLLGEDAESDRYTSRPFFNRYQLDLPVREGPDFFSLIGLRVGKIWRDRKSEMPEDHTFATSARFLSPDRPFTIQGDGNSDWIPVQSQARDQSWAGSTRLESDVPPEFIVKLSFADVETVYRKLDIPLEPGTRAVGLMGQLVPDGLDQEQYPWQLFRGAEQLAEGECLPDIKEAQNRFRHLFAIEEGRSNLVVRLEGAGILEPRLHAVNDQILVEPHTPARAFMTQGFYAADRDGDTYYAWTKARALVAVPVDPQVQQYRLTLTSRVGLHARPGEKRSAYVLPSDAMELHIHSGMFNTLIPLTEDVSTKELIVDVPEGVGPVLTLEFTTTAWQPSEVFEGNLDDRELGFQFYSLDWSPVTP